MSGVVRYAEREAALAAVRRDGRELRYVSEQLRGDRRIVLAAVRRHGRVLRDASERLQDDREVVPRGGCADRTGTAIRLGGAPQ